MADDYNDNCLTCGETIPLNEAEFCSDRCRATYFSDVPLDSPDDILETADAYDENAGEYSFYPDHQF